MSGGYSLAVRHGLVIAVPSLAEHGLRGLHASAVAVGELSSCSSWALEHRLNSYGTQASCSSVCGIFWDQGSNMYLLHWQMDSLPLGHLGSPQQHSLSVPD